jgi:FkbM family methyltransferase
MAHPLKLWCPPPSSDNCDEGIARVLSGEYEAPGLDRALEGILAVIPSVLDIGAHVGAFSVWARERWGYRAPIRGFEPHPESAFLYRLNAPSCDLTEAAVIGADYQNETAPVLFEGRHNSGQRSLRLLDEQDDTAGVIVRTIRARYLPPAHIVKVDTEGLELEILRDYRHLSGVRALMVEWHTVEDYRELVAWLPALGLTLVRDDTRGEYGPERNLIFLRSDR